MHALMVQVRQEKQPLRHFESLWKSTSDIIHMEGPTYLHMAFKPGLRVVCNFPNYCKQI